MQENTSQRTAASKEGGESSARPRRINSLVQRLGYSSYLEVGVARGETFFAVAGCSRKVAVDPRFQFDRPQMAQGDDSERFYQMTSDAYFAGPGSDQVFDFVYLDGLHTWAQTLTDLLNSLARTRQDSLILIDDTVPCDPFSAIPDQGRALRSRAKYGNGSRKLAWHGDVFRVVLYIHDYLPHLSYATIVTRGNPQTLVWREHRTDVAPLTRHATEIDSFDFYWLDEHMDVLHPDPEESVLDRVVMKIGAVRNHSAGAPNVQAAVRS